MMYKSKARLERENNYYQSELQRARVRIGGLEEAKSGLVVDRESLAFTLWSERVQSRFAVGQRLMCLFSLLIPATVMGAYYFWDQNGGINRVTVGLAVSTLVLFGLAIYTGIATTKDEPKIVTLPSGDEVEIPPEVVARTDRVLARMAQG